jgi:hypothetical protein
MKVRNEGQRLLLLASEVDDEIAVQVGVTRSTVESWTLGRSTPFRLRRERLERDFGIPTEAWDMSPAAG